MPIPVARRVSQIIHNRLAIRHRAIVIAEHLFDIRCILGGYQSVIITEEAWKDTVRLIEDCILIDEYPHLFVVDIDHYWGPAYVVLRTQPTNFNRPFRR